jgi:hypothetical protein
MPSALMILSHFSISGEFCGGQLFMIFSLTGVSTIYGGIIPAISVVSRTEQQ